MSRASRKRREQELWGRKKSQEKGTDGYSLSGPQVKSLAEQERERLAKLKRKNSSKPKVKTKKKKTHSKGSGGATAIIGRDRVGMPLEFAMVGLFPSLLNSQKACRRAIVDGKISCNGKKGNTSMRVTLGNLIRYHPNDPRNGPSLAEKVKKQELWNGGGSSVRTLRK